MRANELRPTLDALQVRPSKSLGQNFLRDPNLAAAIVRLAVPEPAEFAVEIGPGLGALTTHLLERCRHVVAVEKDRRLAAWLRTRWPEDRLTVVEDDAARFDWRPLMPRGPFPLLGNLPYAATSPILRNFLGPCSPVTRAVFTVQNEFALRLASGPDSPDYSALTVRVQRLWTVRRERIVPPDVFYPEPGVDSAVVELERRPPREFPPVRQDFFDSLVQKGFSQRRKQVRSLLRPEPGLWNEWCHLHGIPPEARAENLPVARWIELARTLDPAAAMTAQSDDEPFDVVDENDQPVRIVPRSVVHSEQLLHRAVHILVFNTRGELLLQKRSAWKDREPLKWDSSAAGHLEVGETYAAAADRETLEELGISPQLVSLGKIRACSNTGREFVEVFTGVHNGPFVLPPSEVEGALHFGVESIRAWLAARPQDFAPGFLEVWKLWEARDSRK